MDNQTTFIIEGDHGRQTESRGLQVAVVATDTLRRDEAAAALGMSTRQVDRLVTTGRLERVGEGRTVRITIDSIERYRGEGLRREHPAKLVVEAEHYDGLLLQLQAKSRMLEEVSAKLLTWDGERDEMAMLLAAERAESKRLAAELEAERAKGLWSRLISCCISWCRPEL